MKSLQIVYITNCFLWTMSANKAYIIFSYLKVINKPNGLGHIVIWHIVMWLTG